MRRAAYEGLPNFVVIAGPNGAGKSSLLHQLYVNRGAQAEPGTRVIYLELHRPWRKSTLSGAAMYSMLYNLRQSLETDGFLGFQQPVPQGLQQNEALNNAPEKLSTVDLQYLGRQPRVADTADESYSFVKYSIARLGLRRQARMARELDNQGGTIAPDTIPNVFGLLRKLTRYLLPPLRFEQLDLSNEQDYKIFFPSLNVVFGYK